MTEPAWQPCPGQIVGMVRTVRSARLRRRLASAVTVTALLTVVVLAATAFYGPPAPLDCAQTRALMPNYVSHELSAQQATLVSQHLDHCPDCRRHLEEQHGGSSRYLALPPDPLAQAW